MTHHLCNFHYQQWFYNTYCQSLSTCERSWFYASQCARIHWTTTTRLIELRNSPCHVSSSESLFSFPMNTTSFWDSSCTSLIYHPGKELWICLGKTSPRAYRLDI